MYFRSEEDFIKLSAVTIRESAVGCKAVSRCKVNYTLGAERGRPLTV